MNWDPAKHPRHPRGSADGGQFTFKAAFLKTTGNEQTLNELSKSFNAAPRLVREALWHQPVTHLHASRKHNLGESETATMMSDEIMGRTGILGLSVRWSGKMAVASGERSSADIAKTFWHEIGHHLSGEKRVMRAAGWTKPAPLEGLRGREDETWADKFSGWASGGFKPRRRR